MLKTRSQELRERHRKILAWSLVVAVVAHLAIFALTPVFRATPLGSTDLPPDTIGTAAGANALVDVVFGPPTIVGSDGGSWTAPAERILPAQRGARLRPACAKLLTDGRAPLRGRVQLRVKASGRVDVLGFDRETGEPCADEVLREVAGDLWYHWLPDARFPAPVLLVQPVTLVTTSVVLGG